MLLFYDIKVYALWVLGTLTFDTQSQGFSLEDSKSMVPATKNLGYSPDFVLVDVYGEFSLTLAYGRMILDNESLKSVNNQIIYWNMSWGPILLVILKVGISMPTYHRRNRYTKHEQLVQSHHTVRCLSVYSKFKLQNRMEASYSYKCSSQIIPPTVSFHICPMTI